MLANQSRELLPVQLTIIGHHVADLFGTREEDVHWLIQNAAPHQALSDLAQTVPKSEREPRGFIVFQIIQAGVEPGQPQQFGKKEVQIGGKFAEQLQFRLLHPHLQFPLFFDWGFVQG